jgi:subtilisin family serine protease
VTGILRATGRGIRVAVVDTGIRMTPETGAVVAGLSFVDERWHDETGHGTAVAATLRSLAPDAELLAVKVFDRRLETTAALLADGIRWAAQNGAQVINVSAGARGDAGHAAIDEATREATTRGAIVVAPAADDPGGRISQPVPGILRVAADPGCRPDQLRVLGGSGDGFAACPDSVPFAGSPSPRRPRGVSFAVARASAWVCRVRQAMPDADAVLVRRTLRALCGELAARYPT